MIAEHEPFINRSASPRALLPHVVSQIFERVTVQGVASATSKVGRFQRVLTFTNLSQLATGVAAAGLVVVTDSDLQLIYSNYSAYAQDVWHATPSLTLTYGLRYGLNARPSETSGKMPPSPTSLENLATATLATPGTPLYETPRINFAPRAGISYRPFAGRDTTLRGGFGVFYDLGYGFMGSALVPTFFPYARRADLISIPVTAPEFSAVPAPASLNSLFPRLFAYDKEFRLPMTLQYTFGIDQPVGDQGESQRNHDRPEAARPG